jgi:hypothetical protein
MKKRKPRQNATTVKQLVDCINQRYHRHRSNIINEDIAFGDWLLAQKAKVRARGDLWGRVFKDRRIDCSQDTAERYMAMASNSVMRNSAHARIFPRSFYIRSVLAMIPESRLQAFIDAGRIHPKLTREEAEALRKRAGAASRPRLVFGRSINGSVQGDLWHNHPEKLFAVRAIGCKRAPGAHIYTFAQRHLQSPVDILIATLMLSTLLPGERHWPGDGEPQKWALLLRFLFQHEKAGDLLQDLFQMPLDQHEAYVERQMRDAYATHKAEVEAAQTREAVADEAAA